MIVRAFEVLLRTAGEAQDHMQAEWAADALGAERLRIQNAVLFLRLICEAFAEAGYDATVIKSLDHWPDLGSDLDLYTNAAPAEICALMGRRFDARIEPAVGEIAWRANGTSSYPDYRRQSKSISAAWARQENRSP